MAEVEARYRGYVHVDRADGLPSLGQIQKGARLLMEKNQKTARAMHPLFARGLETPLSLSINKSGLKVTLETPEGQQAVVMNHQIHKIAFVLDVGATVCFIVKRAGKGKFNCHAFELSSAKNAHTVATKTAELCNELFSKVRRVSHRVKRKSKAAPAPPPPSAAAAAPSAETKKEDAEAVELTSAIAESDSSAVQEAIREIEASQDKEESATAGATVDFIADIGDTLAQLVLGQPQSTEELALDLDSEMFKFGEVDGEVDC